MTPTCVNDFLFAEKKSLSIQRSLMKGCYVNPVHPPVLLGIAAPDFLTSRLYRWGCQPQSQLDLNSELASHRKISCYSSALQLRSCLFVKTKIQTPSKNIWEKTNEVFKKCHVFQNNCYYSSLKIRFFITMPSWKK